MSTTLPTPPAAALLPPGPWPHLRRWLQSRDPAWSASAVLLALLLAFDAPQVGPSVVFSLQTLLTLSPYLLGAFAFSAYMRASSADLVITRVFRGRTVLMIVAAALFGAWSPLCSCAVVPLVAVLLRAGMPLSAVMAFWISSPIISPGMYVLTAGVLGLEFATAKLLAAMFMGLGAGFLTLALQGAGRLAAPLREGSPAQAVALGEVLHPSWAFWREPARRALFASEFAMVAGLLLKWMFFAFLLESLLLRYVPATLVAQWVGGANQWAIGIAVLVGVPAYLNGVAAVPLVKGLMAMGMSTPAAMAFLLAGSVTSVPAMAAVFPLVRGRVFAWYVLMALLTSWSAAQLFDLYLSLK